MKKNQLIRDIFYIRWPHKISIVILAIISGLCGLFTPYFQRHFLSSLTFFDLIIAATLMLISFLTYQLTIYFSQNEAIYAQRLLSEKLYSHILHLNTISKIHRTTGELVSLYTTDVPSATMWLEQTLPFVLTTTLPLIFTPVFLRTSYDIPIYNSFFCILILLVLNLFMAKRQSLFFSNFKRLAAERMTIVNEWIQNIKNIRLLNWTSAIEEKIFEKRILETKNRVAMVTNGQIMNSFSSSITYWLNLLVILYFLSTSIKNLQKTDILVLIWVVGVFLSRPLRQLPWLLTMFFDALTSIKRLNQILEIQNTDPTFPNTEELNSEFKENNFLLKIKNLNLDLENKNILKTIDLNIKAGEIVALIGPVGSGKSLLLKSIIQETPFTADIFYKQDTVYLPQDPFIFSSFIHNNLSFSYSDTYDEKKSMQALHLAQFDDTLKTGVDLLETLIGERGVNLSGGQKQRLHLARLFFNSQKLFILDDPFSSVDVYTESAIIKNILKLKSDGYGFLVSTQRHSFLKNADRILFLDNGIVTFSGSFTDYCLFDDNKKALK